MSLIQVDSVGNISYTTSNEVATDLTTEISNMSERVNEEQRSEFVSSMDSDIGTLQTSFTDRLNTMSSSVSGLETSEASTRGRVHEREGSFILSEAGMWCPAGFERVTNVNDCRAAVRQLRQRGFSNAHEWRGLGTGERWNNHLYGCWMNTNSEGRVHFNHNRDGHRHAGTHWLSSLGPRLPHEQELSVCKRT